MIDDWGNVTKAINISFVDVVGEFKALKNGMSIIKNQFKFEPIGDHDRFNSIMGPFVSKSKSSLEKLEKDINNVTENYNTLVQKFGYDPKKMVCKN